MKARLTYAGIATLASIRTRRVKRNASPVQRTPPASSRDPNQRQIANVRCKIPVSLYFGGLAVSKIVVFTSSTVMRKSSVDA